jgi:cytochrome P450
MAGSTVVVAEQEFVQQIMSTAFFEDPYPTYRQMREKAPAMFLEAISSWVLTGFDEAYTALRRHDVFSSKPVGLALISDDQPRHTLLRGIVNKTFTPRRIQELEPRIAAIVGGLLDAFAADGEVEVVDALSVPLPVTVIAELLGIPPEERERFKRWSDAVIATESNQYAADVEEMEAYFAEVVAQRKANPAADLFSGLVAAEVDGARMDEREIISFATLLLVAGNETTTNLLSNMLNILAFRPDLWARLREDRGLVEPVIEETLRIDSPVQLLQRTAVADFELNGTLIREGQQLQVAYGAANRDPKAFPQPDEFRTDRELSRHIAFGYGIHFCLGAPLARMEARLALNALLDRYASLEPGDEKGERQRDSFIVRGFKSLPLRLRP